ncbi:MAG TPA: carboxymuconolactone decarboxylase family protein [Rhodospirillales bacterium]
MSRLPQLDPAKLAGRQKEIYDKIVDSPRGGVRGPFGVLLHAPGVADPVQALGAYLRFDSVLPGRLRELAILITARFWTAQFEWHIHRGFAEKEGLDPAIIDAIAARQTPEFHAADEKVVYAYCRELHKQHRVSDATYADAVKVLGAEAVVELTALNGYYTLISMVLNAFEVPVPTGEAPLGD